MEEEIFSTALTVSALLLLMSGVVVVVIINYKRRQQDFIREKKDMQSSFERLLLQSKVEIQEQTFSQLGSELHDNIGQLLTSVRMLIGVAGRSMKEMPATLLEAEQTLVTAIKEMRSLSKSLNREWLSRFDLIENMQGEVVRMNAAGDLAVTLQTDHHEVALSSEAQLILFRIIQEAMQNAIKHAEASHITIAVASETDVQVSITDNGKGMQHAEEGLGMVHMKQRAALLKGHVAWENISDGGTRVLIVLPSQS